METELPLRSSVSLFWYDPGVHLPPKPPLLLPPLLRLPPKLLREALLPLREPALPPKPLRV